MEKVPEHAAVLGERKLPKIPADVAFEAVYMLGINSVETIRQTALEVAQESESPVNVPELLKRPVYDYLAPATVDVGGRPFPDHTRIEVTDLLDVWLLSDTHIRDETIKRVAEEIAETEELSVKDHRLDAIKKYAD